MATLQQVKEKFNPAKVAPAIERVLLYTAAEYEVILRQQLLRGKGSDGQDLTPGYLEDPYFKSKESAMRYATWKWNNSPSTGRNFNAPNLYINGYYHSKLKVFVGANGFIIDALVKFAEDINRKYNGKSTKLGGEFREQFIWKNFRPQLLVELNLA